MGNLSEPLKEKAVKNILKIPFDMEKLTDQLGMGFNYLEFNSLGANEEKSSIGIIDTDLSKEFDAAKEIIEALNENVDKDDVFHNYDIHVYHLNKLSRKGNAHIKNKGEDGKDIIDSPIIEIQGDKLLDGSEFINSMDTGSFIRVRAKAKRINGRFRKLVIEY